LGEGRSEDERGGSMVGDGGGSGAGDVEGVR